MIGAQALLRKTAPNNVQSAAPRMPQGVPRLPPQQTAVTCVCAGKRSGGKRNCVIWSASAAWSAVNSSPAGSTQPATNNFDASTAAESKMGTTAAATSLPHAGRSCVCCKHMGGAAGSWFSRMWVGCAATAGGWSISPLLCGMKLIQTPDLQSGTAGLQNRPTEQYCGT